MPAALPMSRARDPAIEVRGGAQFVAYRRDEVVFQPFDPRTLLLACADVADCRRYQDLTGAFQRAQHDLDGELGAILPLPNELDPRTDLLSKRVFRGAKTVFDQSIGEAVRNDSGDLLAQELVAAESELPLRLKIQEDDFPGLVHHHHGIRSCLQEPAIPRLHLREMLFRFLANADVADRRCHQNSTFGTGQRTEHDLYGELTAVLAPARQLDACPNSLRQRLLVGSKIVRD